MSLFLSFFFGEPSRGLSIRLRDGDASPIATWIGGLQEATQAWARDHDDIFLQSDLGTEPQPGHEVVGLGDYLFADRSLNGPRLGRHLQSLLETGVIHTFLLRPGAPAEPRDLVGRSEVLSRLEGTLSKGRSLHFRAPRRYGKTSVLTALRNRLESAGRSCLHVDLSADPSVPRFLASLTRGALADPGLAERLCKHPLGANWPGPGAPPVERRRAARELEEQANKDPLRAAQQLFEALEGTVFLLDEFSVFLRTSYREDSGALQSFLEFLRDRRQESASPQILAGSAGLNSYIHFHQLEDCFRDLVPVDLPPLAREEGRVLAEELSYGAQIVPDDASIDALLESVGEPVPYFVHALVQALVDSRSRNAQLTAELVREVYEERLLGNDGTRFFSSFQLRGQAYPRELLGSAGRILTRLARADGGLASSDLETAFLQAAGPEHRHQFQPLLACLQEDYDLVEQDGLWTIRCKVLRDRWRVAEPWLTGMG